MKKLLFCILIIFASCRGDEPIIPEIVDPTVPDTGITGINGMYLLNEGNMGSNKCTLDYLDFKNNTYHKNIYPSRNPDVVKELGDVGNDIGVYGGKLYAVVNCSNLIEVMDVHTAKHIATISVPNCRYITFAKGKAYISSYAGEIGVDPNARKGYVAEIDTASLKITRQVTVGYQPEGVAVVGSKLYVTNSGGYRAPNYDRTVSVVDLGSFTETKKIDVAINLHRLKADRKGNIYVNSRGNNSDIPSKLFVINTQNDRVEKQLDIEVSNFCISGDSVYLFSMNETTRQTGYAIINTNTREIVNRNFITDGTDKNIKVPFGIAVNPETKDIFITDATDYTTPGKLYWFSADGKKKWETVTGDIPAHMVFTKASFTAGENPGEGEEEEEEEPDLTGKSPYITRILDFCPAPGQFVNEQPRYEPGDTQEKMNEKVLKALEKNNRGTVSLGGYGGYVVVGFDHTIRNRKGEKDFRVLGNSFVKVNGQKGGSAEPGIVMVAYDRNKNGLPDEDEWYELAGSEYHKPETVKNYEITYTRPYENKKPVKDPTSPSIKDKEYLSWRDNQRETGFLPKLAFHTQAYYPGWIAKDELVFRGTRLAPNGVNEGSGSIQNWVLYHYEWGYADNLSNDSDGSCFDIDWAIDKNGQRVNLQGVDFIKVYTGVNQVCGWTGEVSTEILGVTDLGIESAK